MLVKNNQLPIQTMTIQNYVSYTVLIVVKSLILFKLLCIMYSPNIMF